MDIEKDVILFLKYQTSHREICETTDIASIKFGLFDLDAESVMEEFFKNYNIDCCNFVIENYFHYPEYNWRDLVFFSFLFKKIEYPKKQSLTVRHLIKVVEKGEWFNPE